MQIFFSPIHSHLFASLLYTLQLLFFSERCRLANLPPKSCCDRTGNVSAVPN